MIKIRVRLSINEGNFYFPSFPQVEEEISISSTTTIFRYTKNTVNRDWSTQRTHIDNLTHIYFPDTSEAPSIIVSWPTFNEKERKEIPSGVSGSQTHCCNNYLCDIEATTVRVDIHLMHEFAAKRWFTLRRDLFFMRNECKTSWWAR